MSRFGTFLRNMLADLKLIWRQVDCPHDFGPVLSQTDRRCKHCDAIEHDIDPM